jgi:glycosyltransferase involved in cell wall biosynthesis
MPADTGNGLAMRAGIALAALARRFDVHLGLIPVAGAYGPVSSLAQRAAASVRWLNLSEHLDPHYALIERVIDPEERTRFRLAYPKPLLSRFCTSRSADEVAAWSEAEDVAAVHVMRLYLAPFAEKLAGIGATPRRFLVLDLDEDEVTTRRSLAALHRRRGAAAQAATEEQEAEKYAALMARSIAGFDRILVSSPLEAQRVRERIPVAPVRVLPNAAPRNAAPARALRRTAGPIRLLFVGNLSYMPNEDAVVFLCREVLPHLRRVADRPIEVIVAGGGASPETAALADECRVTLAGPVEDLRPLYGDADIAVVPLRAGGGTRIKVLEAFASSTPVVATPIGIEGIAAAADEHAMIAETPDGFAQACLALVAEPIRADTMAACAREFVDRVYRAELVEAALLALYDSFS